MISPFAKADATSWLDSTDPVLGLPSLLQDGQTIPESYGGQNCSEHTFITRPSMPAILQTEISHVGCGVQTKYGIVDPAGWVEMNGTQVAGRITSSAGNTNIQIFPIPNSTTLMLRGAVGNGVKINFYENFRNTMTPEVATDGSVKYKLPVASLKTLEDLAGNDLYIRPETMGFSNSGEWMIADSQYLATLRINTQTYEVVPFQSPYTYHLGTDPQVHTTVSDDGKYALTTSRFAHFKIVDISSCAVVPSTISGPVGCQFKLFNTFLGTNIPGFQRASQPRFVGNDVVDFYAIHQNMPGVNVTSKYRMVPPGGTIESIDYLALGDSFTSGEGTYDYFPETDTQENDCHLSPISYPYLIGQALSLDSYNSVACSGAWMKHISEVVQKPDYPSNNTLGGFLPGFKKQLAYVQESNPDIVTVSIGGNDIGFGNIVHSCVGVLAVIPGTCYDSYEERKEILQKTESIFDNITSAFHDIKQNTPSSTKVFVFGYPNIAQENGDCAVNVRLNNQEIKFSNDLIDYMNRVVEKAAQKAGVKYIDISSAFDDHKMCETVSSEVAVNGLGLGVQTPVSIMPVADEAYHPNQIGHQLYKDKIIEQTNSFTESMPAPDPNATPPAITDDMPLLLGMPRTGREVRQVSFVDNMSGATATRGSVISVAAGAISYALKSFANYTIELHSEPVTLGIATTDDGGNLLADVSIPNNVEPGVHTVHVIGQNIAGEEIDIQQTIYIKYSESDFDGDFIPNSFDACPYSENHYIDNDMDGIDDGCDGYIGETPPEGLVLDGLPIEPGSIPELADGPTPLSSIPELVAIQVHDQLPNKKVRKMITKSIRQNKTLSKKEKKLLISMYKNLWLNQEK